MKRFIVFITFVMSAFLTIAGNSDYTSQIRKKVLEKKLSEAQAAVAKVSRINVEDNDPVILEAKLRQKDSLILCAKSQLLTVQMEIAEFEKTYNDGK